ncbi:hypothetical protein [Chryseosolibacter indicus]|uniref:Uncharacterized protein n=1 Tax=Chryseosolibacter indicus TaxID=2782351 RepID=A0ABS5VYL8_9BACT|nr:hypothetical protein [Chryseosolibacter indicus]MBT1705844.1 hypothetical protein [Chryseosolibacter indicus]
MKLKFLTLALCIGLFTACNDDDDKSPSWGIDYSSPETTLSAQGSIDQQNAGPKVTFVVDEAYVVLSEDDKNLHVVRYQFSSNDYLDLIIAKRTSDYNYHFPGSKNENTLVSAIYNGKALSLKESAVSIQPRPEEDSFHTVVNVHTNDAGDFNGTVNGVPLLKREEL